MMTTVKGGFYVNLVTIYLILLVLIDQPNGSQASPTNRKVPFQDGLVTDEALREFYHIPESSRDSLSSLGKIDSESVVPRLEGSSQQAGTESSDDENSQAIDLTKELVCGNHDSPDHLEQILHHSRIRVKRFPVDFPLEKNVINYKIMNYPKDSDEEEQLKIANIFEFAFKTWSSEIPIQFRMVTKDADPIDLRISFVRDHECQQGKLNNFTKAYGHANFPRDRSQFIHISDHFDWSLEPRRSKPRVRLLVTAIHEIGHTVGLHHTKVTKSVMNEHYGDLDRLQDEDIESLNVLYPQDQTYKIIDRTLTMVPGSYRRNAPDLKACLDYMNDALINLAVFNSNLLKCFIIPTDEPSANEVMQTKTGRGLTRHIIHGPQYNCNSTESRDAYLEWIGREACDAITEKTNKFDSAILYTCKCFNHHVGSQIIIRRSYIYRFVPAQVSEHSESFDLHKNEQPPVDIPWEDAT